MTIQYRIGQLADCRWIAEGIELAAGGITTFLLQDLVAGKTPVDLMEESLQVTSGADSYNNALIADAEGEMAGMVFSYPASGFGISEEMRQLLPPERLAHVTGFFSQRVEDSLFLDSIYVAPPFRGQGVVDELIQGVKQRSRQLKLNGVSLMVLADNTPAQRVYERHGFRKVTVVPLDYHALIPHHGGAYLMHWQP